MEEINGSSGDNTQQILRLLYFLGVAQFWAGNLLGSKSSYERYLQMQKGSGQTCSSDLARATNMLEKINQGLDICNKSQMEPREYISLHWRTLGGFLKEERSFTEHFDNSWAQKQSLSSCSNGLFLSESFISNVSEQSLLSHEKTIKKGRGRSFISSQQLRNMNGQIPGTGLDALDYLWD